MDSFGDMEVEVSLSDHRVESMVTDMYQPFWVASEGTRQLVEVHSLSKGLVAARLGSPSFVESESSDFAESVILLDVGGMRCRIFVD